MNSSQINTLWDTYDFTLQNITNLEDKVAFFVAHVDKKAALVEAEAITEEDFLNFCEESLQDHVSLLSFYDKQTHTLKDLVKIKPVDQPIEREVAISSLNELINLTATLKLVIDDARLSLEQMIKEIKLSGLSGEET